MEAVHIGVGGEDDFLVAQFLDGVLDIETAHQVIEFDILVEGVAAQRADVARLALEREDGLGLGVTAADQ